MNIFLGIFAVVIGTYFGYKFSYKYQYRLDFIRELSEFNKNLITNVSFTKNSIISMVEKLGRGNFNDYIKKYYDNNSFELEERYFTSDEKDFINNYLLNIGTTDAISQLKSLQSYDEKIKEKLSNAESDNKKYKSLYVKLGFLFGLIVFIVLL